MRIVMVLLVRDAADVIAANLDHHFGQGVDFAVVMDHRSRDGTTDILREYAGRGDIRLIRRRGRYSQAEQVTELARLAVEHGADWVLPNDADEFWVARSGTVREALAEAPDDAWALRCRRHNFLPTPEDGRPWWERMTLRQRESTNARGKPLPGKVVLRAWPGIQVRKGNHRPHESLPGPTVESAELEVLHFQRRSYVQFEADVRRMAREHRRAKQDGEGPGKARLEQVGAWQRGELRGLYDAELVTAAEDDVVEDTRLRDSLRRLAEAGTTS